MGLGGVLHAQRARPEQEQGRREPRLPAVQQLDGRGASMCCNVGTGDVCRDNGLCFNPSVEHLWRESCTDPTWKDPACVKLCHRDILNAQGILMSGTDMRITVCSDGSLCCGDKEASTECCREKSGFLIVDGEVVAASQPSSTTGTQTTARSTSSTSTSTSSSDDPESDDPEASNTGNDDGSSGPNKAVIIGAVLGSVFGVALIAAAWVLYRRSQRRGPSPPVTGGGVMDAAPEYKAVSPPPVELETEHNYYRYELGGERRY
ncbi:unnamed protein product [Parascedosporium putredinis]|uniref:Mid2 domain-containing protein n=1 Tax=Parascedosporium putredinis TaxID=1442378 RepID=A0A9P1M7L6_9PEZI|nr:unnamed protein product [Parascedosporium putredinis]CAI7991908.1 unnamed protein product [Parascedosporium putredinis]